MKICKEIQAYTNYVRSPNAAVCEEQTLLCDMVERIFREEEIYVNEEQLARYLKQQRFFPFDLLDWEKFCFTLHNCTYTADGSLRWPELHIIVGRGTGKNGYLSFEDFCLITPVNGVKEYHIDMFATSEDQAKTSFMDIYNILEDNKDYFKNYFKWNLEKIQNLKTGSVIAYHTRNPGTKDGGRPGKVDFDEYHAYLNYELIEVVESGLGKKQHPRETIISSAGDVRDGPFDEMLENDLDILRGVVPDGGTLPFICRLGENADEEVMDHKNWQKANPSLRFMPNLKAEMEREFRKYLRDPVNHAAFMTKRMNRPRKETEYNVTAWDNLVAATRELPELKGKSCVAGIDFAKSNDFVVAGLLFKEDGKYAWKYHVWVCEQSQDLPKIKFPLREAEAEGFLTFVKESEISPEYVTDWLTEQMKSYIIECVAIDNFRYALMTDALKKIGFSDDKKNVKLVRPTDLMKAAVVIGYVFSKHLLAWGTCKIMRWFTWNTKATIDKKGNTVYEKIEPKARKTDGFHAMAASFTVEDRIKQRPKIGRHRIGTVC